MHGYANPWPAGGGKNKFNDVDPTLANWALNNGVFTNSATDTRAYVSLSIQGRLNGRTVATFFKMIVNTTGRVSRSFNVNSEIDTLVVKHSGSARDFNILFPFSGQGDYIFSADFTGVDPTTVGGVVMKECQIEAGTTVSTYSPYSNICPISGWTEAEIYHEAEYDADADPAITVTFPETIYGGEDEVISGKLKKTMGMVDLGTLEWRVVSGASGIRLFKGVLPDAKTVTTVSGLRNTICSQYKLATNGMNMHSGVEDCVYLINSTYLGEQGYIYIRDTEYDSYTAEQFKAAVSGVQLCYELAEPVEYTMTGNEIIALDGTNVIWANTGDVNVTYIAKSAKFSFGSPLHNYNYNNLKLFGNTYIEHGKG